MWPPQVAIACLVGVSLVFRLPFSPIYQDLIDEACHDLKPTEDAPFAITNWEPDSDTQPEPDETDGERTTQPAEN